MTRRSSRTSVGAVAVAIAGAAACSAGDDRAAAQRDRTRAIAAAAFAEPLEALAARPGVQVTDLEAGKGAQPVPPRTFVRVGGPASTGELSFDALLARLASRGWTLSSGTGSANTCTQGAQALPCQFGRADADDVITVVPRADGGYEITASDS